AAESSLPSYRSRQRRTLSRSMPPRRQIEDFAPEKEPEPSSGEAGECAAREEPSVVTLLGDGRMIVVPRQGAISPPLNEPQSDGGRFSHIVFLACQDADALAGGFALRCCLAARGCMLRAWRRGRRRAAVEATLRVSSSPSLSSWCC